MKTRKPQFYAVKIPPVSREYAKYLDSIFPKLDIRADTPHDAIKWNAAQREVVDHIIKTSINHEVSGELNRIRSELEAPKYTPMQSLLSKIGLYAGK